MKQLYVIGDPVSHSKSPLLHNTMNQLLGLDYVYGCKTVKKDSLEDFLTEIKGSNCAGFNATMPFKELLLPYLDEVEPLAARLGAVNTVCIRDGKLYGYNTDCPGFTAALRRRGFEVAGKRALLLGAGGAAKAVAVGLCAAGAEVLVANRDAGKAKTLAALYPQGIQAISWNEVAPSERLSQVELVVNATPVGMDKGDGNSPQNLTDILPKLKELLTFLPKTALVSDLIYHPAPTAFLQEAEQLGLAVMDGFPLLIHQAILAFEHFSQHSVPVDRVLPALEAAVRKEI